VTWPEKNPSDFSHKNHVKLQTIIVILIRDRDELSKWLYVLPTNNFEHLAGKDSFHFFDAYINAADSQKVTLCTTNCHVQVHGKNIWPWTSVIPVEKGIPQNQ
jgi:hypothetical protein